MEKRSIEVQDMLAAARCTSRMEQVREIVDVFRFSLPHPHHFYPSNADVCWRQEVREVIEGGTEQEFQNCKFDIQSKISEWSATWLEERRGTFLGLLPQASPTVEHLSLATTLFSCTKCHRGDWMRIDEALSHRCCWSGELEGTLSDQNCKAVYRDNVGAPWNSGVSRYQYSTKYAQLVKEVPLECGENPETITIREMNEKHHRFASFGVMERSP